MARNGDRPVSSRELDAHLQPMREDIRALVRDQREFAEFMTGAINSRAIQLQVHKSRQFWIGVAVSMMGVSVAAVGLLLSLH